MGLFSRFGRRRSFHRAAERYDCRIEARLQMCDNGVIYEGRLNNLSVGGAMFRPALVYLLEQRGPVLLYVNGGEIEAQIVATTPQGYGLRFEHAIDEARLRGLLAESNPPAVREAA